MLLFRWGGLRVLQPPSHPFSGASQCWFSTCCFQLFLEGYDMHTMESDIWITFHLTGYTCSMEQYSRRCGGTSLHFLRQKPGSVVVSWNCSAPEGLDNSKIWSIRLGISVREELLSVLRGMRVRASVGAEWYPFDILSGQSDVFHAYWGSSLRPPQYTSDLPSLAIGPGRYTQPLRIFQIKWFRFQSDFHYWPINYDKL